METIGARSFLTYMDDGDIPEAATNRGIRSSNGHGVETYYELAKCVSKLQFLNPDYLLMFRGQTRDHMERGLSTFRPSIFRFPSTYESSPLHQFDLADRFTNLADAERLLVKVNSLADSRRSLNMIRRQRIVRWSILQHYEVCPTPLLDVTQSLRIAASFASSQTGANAEVFLFVFGIPLLSGGITASAEAGIQVARLASVCPPMAVRPHLQEGYLMGEYPEIYGLDQVKLYEGHETDFGLRLMAKFRFVPGKFWSDPAFPIVPRNALFPDEGLDPFLSLANEIRAKVIGDPFSRRMNSH